MKRVLLIGALVLTGLYTSAQELGFTPELGKCYEKCYIPTVYETFTDSVMIKDSFVHTEIKDPEWKSVYKRFKVKDSYTVHKVIPAKFKTEMQKVLVQAEYRDFNIAPAEFEPNLMEYTVVEATKELTMKRSKNCMSADPDDCFVLCYEELPAVTRTYTMRDLVSDGQALRQFRPNIYKEIEVEILTDSARIEVINVPPDYIMVETKEMTTPPTIVYSQIPAEYMPITIQRVVKAGSYSEWREVLCEDKLTLETIGKIQQQLLDSGYDLGEGGVDKMLGPSTRAALMEYQKDHNLPIGNLNLETLESLGIPYNE